MQSFCFPRDLVVCVLVRAAMDVDTVPVMSAAATNLVPVVMITPADFIFLAAAVVVYLGEEVTSIWWARCAHWDGMVYFSPFGECYHLEPDCRGLRNAIQSAPGGIVYCGPPLTGATPTRATPRGEKKIKVVAGPVMSVQHSSSLEPVMLKASIFVFVVFSCSTGAWSTC